MLAHLKGHAPTHPRPWRQVEQGMASPGWNRPSLAPRKNGGGTGPPSIAGQCLGDGKVGLPILSCSKIMREDRRWYSSSTKCTPACHDVAAQGMAHHHPDMESDMAKSLNNQVLCMISEYHLMCLSQGSSYISLVLPEVAKDLLPSKEEYMTGGDFQRTWDLRVLEKAKTLPATVWLHRLDMAMAGDEMASYSLDATQHGRGPLLGFLLTPQASSLMSGEVIHWVLAENRCRIESSLDNV